MRTGIYLSVALLLTGCNSPGFTTSQPKAKTSASTEFARPINIDGFTTRVDFALDFYPTIYATSDDTTAPKKPVPNTKTVLSIGVKYTYTNATQKDISLGLTPSIHLRSPSGEIYLHDASGSMSTQSQNFVLRPGEWGSEIRIFNVPKDEFDRRTWMIVFNGENRGTSVPMTNAEIYTWKNGDKPF